MIIDKLLLDNKVEEAQKLACENIKILRLKWQEEGITNPPNTFISISYWCRDVSLSLLSLMFFYYYKNLLIINFGYIISVMFSGIIQGTIWTGLWILAHECGHGAFSKYKIINNIFGYITHSFLLVPYYSWQYSHKKHHKYTNHVIKGEAFLPIYKSSLYISILRYIIYIIGNTIFTFLQIIGYLLLGWPSYLFLYITGGRTQYDLTKKLNRYGLMTHFLPCQIFPPKVYRSVIYSTIGCFITLLIIYNLYCNDVDIIYHYISPYLIVNSWLVLYTWLQHTDKNIPHYGTDVFTFEIGAISTIDRNYPYIIDQLHHHIGTTHVVHHIDYKIPHYRAVRATEIIKEVLGDTMYRKSKNSILYDLWNVSKTCHFVDKLDGTAYYKTL